MAYHHVVMTAGISAFGGTNLGRAWLEENFRGRYTARGPTIDASEPEVLLRQAVDAPLPPWDQPAAVCAEASLVRALGRQLAPSARVDLVHTATFSGQMAARFVQLALRQHYHLESTLLPVADLDAEHPEQMRRSLGEYLGVLGRCLSGGHPSTTCFAPIGGYKVMTSLGYLTGALLGFDTLYVHEVGQRLIRIPAVPLNISPEGMERARPSVWRVRDAEVVALAELEDAERQAVEDFPWLFDRTEDDLVSTSAFTELLLGTDPYRTALDRRVFVTKDVLDHDIHRLNEAIRMLLDELGGARRTELLEHEQAFGHHHATFHAYRTRTDGRVRLVWRSPAPDRVEIRALWLDDHPTYERVVRRGDVLTDSPNLQWLPYAPA